MLRYQIKDRDRDNLGSLQSTQPTSDGAETAVTNCCANCLETSRPQHWVPDLLFLYKSAMLTRWMAGASPHKSG